tara:strand:- start:87 stop:212 length:126 start_codon:yes stop_codon:yes gene_type:complete
MSNLKSKLVLNNLKEDIIMLDKKSNYQNLSVGLALIPLNLI